MAFDPVEALLQTQALRLAPPGEVFWYTSGTIGPYYINTHYLYGGRQQAEELLAFIDSAGEERGHFPARLRERVTRHCREDRLYGEVIERLAARIRARVGDRFDGVSGGERRDWFFSLAVAENLGKPHLFIYKDLSTCWFDGVAAETRASLAGLQVVHVADLVTEASSYLRAWIPVVRDRGGRMTYSANVVDRGQGGLAAIEQAGVPAEALVRVDESLFDSLFRSGRIDAGQRVMLTAYYQDPHGAMKAFLEQNPGFLRRALASPDGRTAARARMLVEQNPYGLDAGLLES
jgi:orotate phosphoribosyltransferase